MECVSLWTHRQGRERAVAVRPECSWLWVGSEEAWRGSVNWPAGWVVVMEQVDRCKLRRNEQINRHRGHREGKRRGQGRRRAESRCRVEKAAGKVRERVRRCRCRCPAAEGWNGAGARSFLYGIVLETDLVTSSRPSAVEECRAGRRHRGRVGLRCSAVSKFLPISGRRCLVERALGSRRPSRTLIDLCLERETETAARGAAKVTMLDVGSRARGAEERLQYKSRGPG